MKAQGWSAKQGSVLLLPDGKGGISGALLGTGGRDWAAQAPLLTGVSARERCPKATIASPRSCPIPSLPRSAFSPAATGSPATKRRRRQAEALGSAGGGEQGPGSGSGRGALFRPRSHQHAGQRSRPCRARERRARACHRLRREHQGHRGLGPAVRQFPHDPRRGPRQRSAPAADRSPLGLRARAQGDDRRQGHLLRHRRPRHQAGERHGADEEGHGRRRLGARLRASRHARQAAGAAPRADPCRRELRSPAMPSGRATCCRAGTA